MTKVELLNYFKSHKKSNLMQERHFKIKLHEIYQDLLSWYFPDNFIFTQKLYHYLNDDKDLKLGICPICGKRSTFLSFGKTYSKYCSIKCSKSDNEVKQKTIETCIERYGCKNPAQADNIRNKISLKRKGWIKTYEETIIPNNDISKESLYKILLSNPQTECREFYFKLKYPKFYNDLSLWLFPKDFIFSQKLYHYFNEDKELKLGICTICGKRCTYLSIIRGYYNHCSISCIHHDINTLNKSKHTNQEKRGVDYPAQSEEVKEKIKHTNQDKRGVDYSFQSEEVKEKIKHTNQEKRGVDYPAQSEEVMEKMKQTNLKRRGVENPFQSEEVKEKIKHTNQDKRGVDNPAQSEEVKEKIKQSNLEKYSVDNYAKTQECVMKIYNTKKKNNSFNTSKIEEDLYKWFIENNINVIRQYKSELYPFTCDFYLPDYDLYIEINGIWTHGEHPFDENNKDDIKKLNIWKSKNTKYYNNAIKVWTERDILKRNTAKQNNLNYLEIFSTNFEICLNEIKKRIV